MALPQYCTLEDVKRALDSKETARNDAQLQRAVESASRLIENDCHRWFYPWSGTRYFDWPSVNYKTPWRLYLDVNEVTAVTAVVAGGLAVTLADVFLEPNDLGPPYGWLEIDRSTSSSFSTGTTPQRAIAVTGTFGYCNTTETAGTLAAAISSTSTTTVTVSDSSLIGTGDTIVVDSERMLVTQRSMVTTSQTGSLTSSVADVTLAVSSSGAAYSVGEVLLLNSERVLVVDIAGNNLTVKRAWDGTVLATHTTATIYALRQLTVTRGLTGTTAATHLISAAVSRQTVPGPIRDYAIALSMNRYLQEVSGYARNIVRDDGGSDSSGATLAKPRTRIYLGGALPELKRNVVATYGRTRWAAI